MTWTGSKPPPKCDICHKKNGFFFEGLPNVAPLYLLVKDHKEYSGSGPPKTRAVCRAINGMDVHLSNILSPIIEALADNMKKKDEVISTDDALSRPTTHSISSQADGQELWQLQHSDQLESCFDLCAPIE